jgi:Tfp pilus assembly PilM family ATPase
LSSLSDMQVTSITDPLQVFDTNKRSEGLGRATPELSVATGLALRGQDVHG